MSIGYGVQIEKASNIVFGYDENNPKFDLTNKRDLRGRNPASTGSNETQYVNDDLISRICIQNDTSGQTAPGDGFSFYCWIRRTAATTGTWNQICLIDSGGPRNRTLWFGWYYNQNWRIHNSLPYWNGGTPTYWSVDPYLTSVVPSPSFNTWYHYGCSYNNSTRQCRTFWQGQFAQSGTRPGTGDLNTSNNSNVRLYGTNEVSSNNGQIKSMTMFDTPLSDNAFLENFNKTKARFGY